MNSPGLRFSLLLLTALLWNLPSALAAVLIARAHHTWHTSDLIEAIVWSIAFVVIGSMLHAVGAFLAARGFNNDTTGANPRNLTSEAPLLSRALWPIALLVTPIIALVMILEPNGLSGVGTALTLVPGLVVGLIAVPFRVSGRLFRLQARRVLDRVREAYPPEGVCEDCGLPIARQSPKLAPTHPLAWLIPAACLLAVIVGLATFVALTMPGSGGINGLTIWWSWRGAALLALPVYLILVGSWFAPRWLITRPIRFVRARRLALGTCVLCEHGLLNPRA